MKKKIAIFTGAGVSAESGIATFRSGENALWEGYNIMEVATPEGWRKDREKVLEFYNERRRQLTEVEPNGAHIKIGELESKYDVTIITQNVDDLHERGGSTNVIHVHGELTKASSSYFKGHNSILNEVYDIGYNDIKLGEKCETTDSQLRPHIVWFGEMPLDVNLAEDALVEADIVLIVGTSLNISYTIPLLGECIGASGTKEMYYIDPSPSHALDQYGLPITYITKNAVEGVTDVVDVLLNRD